VWQYRVMGDELLTVDQAAERLQMHADTVRRLLREGQLPGRKVGARQWRISADALKAYVEGGKPAEAGE
jgi:excisionase family DNA binding protein